MSFEQRSKVGWVVVLKWEFILGWALGSRRCVPRSAPPDGGIVRQLLTKSLIVTAIGVGLGIVLAKLSGGLAHLSSSQMREAAPPSWITFDIDGPVLAFAWATNGHIGFGKRGLVVFQIGVTCMLLVASLSQERSSSMEWWRNMRFGVPGRLVCISF